MALNITQEQYDILNTYVTTGDYIGGWAYLASIGDTYADNAYAITSGTANNIYDSVMIVLVKNHWENTAGADAYANQFEQVARQHFQQYVADIQSNPNYSLPSTEQIEESYRTAVVNANLPPETAIDGVFTQTIAGVLDWLAPIEFLDAGHKVIDWPDFLNMEAERQVPSHVFDGLDKDTAWGVLLSDFADTTAELTALGMTEAAAWFDQFNEPLVEAFHNFTFGLYGGTNKIESLMDSFRDLFNQAETEWQSCPIILDLDNDGIETVDLKRGSYFDYDGNGFAEQTGWVGYDDGILVRDINSNGVIDNGSELFGDETLLSTGGKAVNGFAALADLDSNIDGRLDTADTAWSTLKVWKDVNGDGHSTASELFTLEESGVQSIYTGYSVSTYIDANGNEHKQIGTFTRTDGTTGTAADVWFQTDKAYTVATEYLAVPADIRALPFLNGFGNVYDLHQAMVRDTSGQLKNLMQSFAAENDSNIRTSQVEQILYLWTGSNGIDPMSRGGNFDARKLSVLEKFFGEAYQGSNGANPIAQAVDELTQAYNGLTELLYAQLMSQTHLKNYFDLITYSWDEASQTIKGDLSAVVLNFKNSYALDPVAAENIGLEFIRTIKGFNSETLLIDIDQLRAGDENLAWINDSYGLNKIGGTNSNDILISTTSSLGMRGFDGDDIIYGGSGDNAIHGNDGNDVISLGAAGNNIIDSGAGNDRIYLKGYGYSTTDLRAGNDVLITLRGTNLVGTVNGGDGNDHIVYANLDGVIDGGAGDDVLKVDIGPNTGAANIFKGGTGSDRMEGNNGSDTYVFNRGDGEDTVFDNPVANSNTGTVDKISFGFGIVSSDLSFRRTGNNLIADINNPNNPSAADRLVIEGWWSDGEAHRIEAFDFTDGTSLTQNQIDSMVINANTVISGTSGNDFVEGWAGTVHGLEGDDVISDTDGGDNTIYAGDGNDRVYLSGSGASSIDGGAGNDTIKTSNSSVSANVTGGEGNDIIMVSHSTDNILDGGSGDDYLAVDGRNGSGSNTFRGGAGIDRMEGGAGVDTYEYNRGDGQDMILDNPAVYDTAASQDKILFGTGITIADLSIKRIGDNLVVDVNDSLNPNASDSLTIESWWRNNGVHRIESFMFADGTSLSMSEIQTMACTVTGTTNDDALISLDDNDTIYGLDGNDTVFDTGGSNIIDGGSGDDVLSLDIVNNSGNTNRFIGGIGNDRLVGSSSADTYVFNRGDGQDTINDNLGNYNVSTQDKVEFGPGITSTDLKVTKNGNNLVIDVNDSANPSATDRLTIENWWGSNGDLHRIELFTFADGTSLTTTQIHEMATTLTGTEGNDIIAGWEESNTIYGLGGDDTISSGNGNDVIYGGDGNDTITTGVSGTNIINGGNGDDTISAGSSSHNTIDAGDGNDTVNVYWDTTNTIEGGAGDDVLGVNLIGNGGGRENTFHGGIGNDRLVGSNGSDTYIFNRGDGQDTINDNSANHTFSLSPDTVSFGSGIMSTDLQVTRSGDHLVIDVNDPGNPAATDRLTIENWWEANGELHRIELFTFADGTSLTKDQVHSMAATLTGTAGNDSLAGWEEDNIINGLEGNDTITDAGGSNTIYGGAGADTITTGSGGTNIIDGGDGDDTVTVYFDSNNTVQGGAGDDVVGVNLNGNAYWLLNTLHGGTGNDRIIGSNSSETYVFNRGDGQDVINENSMNYTFGSSQDKVSFGAGIISSDLQVTRSGNHLIIDVNDPGNPVATDRLTIENWWGANGELHRIELFTFADGTSLTKEQIHSMASTLTGTENNDTLSGWEEDNTIYGLNGDDIITDSNGSNTIYAGSGNDNVTVSGTGPYNTVYAGDGNDTVTVSKDSYNTVEGGAGDDLISVQTGDARWITNRFLGGTGNDRLVGSSSADTYVFNRGDGQDTISDNPGNYSVTTQDIVEFGLGIISSDLRVMKNGDNLVIDINDPANPQATDRLTVENWFLDDGKHYVETFTFSDGTSLTASEVYNLSLILTGTSGNDILSGWEDDNTIYGFDGNDSLTDTGGNNTIDGGTGDDVISVANGGGTTFTNRLIGGSGNDLITGSGNSETYVFNRGDGQDTINDNPGNVSGAGSDKVEFGTGITSADLRVTKSGNNLVIDVNDPANPLATDRLTIENWWGNGSSLTPIFYAGMDGNWTDASGNGNDGTAYNGAAFSTTAKNGTNSGSFNGNYVSFGNNGDLNLTTAVTLEAWIRPNTVSGTQFVAGRPYSDSTSWGNPWVGWEMGVKNGQMSTWININGVDQEYTSGTIVAGTWQHIAMTFDGTWRRSYINGVEVFSSNAATGAIQFSNNPAFVVGSRSATALGEYFNGLVDDVKVFDHALTASEINAEYVSSPNNQRIESFTFADGTSLTLEQIHSMALAINGTQGNDVLTGTDDNDTIYGFGGDDNISSGNGNDEIYGGDGNDVITTGTGGTKILYSGNGNDTITGSGSTNSIEAGDGNDTITVSNNSTNTVDGGAGDDVISVASGGSTSLINRLIGGPGNDLITGSGNSETYVFNRGDGQDTINDNPGNISGAGSDTVEFESGITSSDLIVTKNGNNLFIDVNDPANPLATDRLTIENWWSNGNSPTPIFFAGMDGNWMDASGSGNDGTAYNGAAFSTTAKNGTNSGSFNGNYVSFGNGSSFNLTTAVTLEAWIKPNTVSGTQFVAGRPYSDSTSWGNPWVGWEMGVKNGQMSTWININGVDQEYTAGTIAAGTWQHIAMTFDGTWRRSYINGVEVFSSNTATGAIQFSKNPAFVVGSRSSTALGEYFNGLVDDVKVFDRALTASEINAEYASSPNNQRVELFTFTDGTSLTAEQIHSMALAINGTQGNDVLTGWEENNTVYGLGGDDVIDGGTGPDTLMGGDGNDTYVVDNIGDIVTENSGEGIDTVQSYITYALGANIENLTLTGTAALDGTGNDMGNIITGNSAANILNGGAGNDTLNGGVGTDTLIGGIGDDTYVLGRDYGSDTITENDNTSGNTDVASFLSGIAKDQIWFSQQGNNLDVSIIGTSDKFTVTNWYLGAQYQVEQFRTAENDLLLNAQVDNLVSAMAAFAPPSAGQTTLPANYQDDLNPVIAANWQ